MSATRALSPPAQNGLGPKEPTPAKPALISPGRSNAGRPAPVNPVVRRISSAPVAAGVQTKRGAANESGMGIPAGAIQALLGLPDAQPTARALGDNPLDFPCEQVGGPGGPLVAPFSCSRSTFDFLRANILRNPGDMQVIILYGLQRFDRSVGQHQIALDKGGRDTPNAITKDGAIVIPDGQAFIVTDFIGVAFQSVFGLPGAVRSIDPASLCLNLCFSFVQQNGQQALAQSALIGGLGGNFCNGTPFLNDPAVFGYPALTQTIKIPAQALYTVQVPPFPGFPDVIGARVKGYLVNQQLLSAVQDRPVTNG